MRILHYALGFPPYRTGGLTKYCMDLMSTQRQRGDEVGLLWPGRMRLPRRNTTIRAHAIRKDKIASFELIDPLPVPFDEGIRDPATFMTPVDPTSFQLFLESWKPDVIHVHSLMGLPLELLQCAGKMHIRMVFTTHDYFGICPRVTFFRDGIICNGNCAACVQCNANGLSTKKMLFLQHPLYRILKDTAFVKVLRKRHRHTVNETDGQTNEHTSQTAIASTQDYTALRNYYIEMLELMDILHFNSSIAENIYRRFCKIRDGRRISITHADITDHKELRDSTADILHITYLAPAKYFKGFDRLITALDALYTCGMKDFELHIYSPTTVKRDYLHIHDGYQYADLGRILGETDVMTAPSIWYETFGFTVAEALSYGVPVVISTTVGAKDIVGTEFGIITDDIEDAFRQILNDRSMLQRYRNAICEKYQVKQMSAHAEEIEALYTYSID